MLSMLTLPTTAPDSSVTPTTGTPYSMMRASAVRSDESSGTVARAIGHAVGRVERLADGRERQTLERPLRPHEPGHEVVCGVGQDALGRVVLHEAALAHDGDAVAEFDGLIDVVGHEHHGLAQPGLDGHELALQPLTRERVDRPERLVHQQDGRVGRQRPGHAYALGLASRELVGVLLGIGRPSSPTSSSISATRSAMRSGAHSSSRGTTPMFSATV